MSHDDVDYHNPEDTTASRLFDLRTLIGAVFVLYGILLTVVGLLDSDDRLAKANGLRINFWTGVFMLVLGLLFLLWVWLRPLRLERHPLHEDEGPEHEGGARDDEGRGYDSRYDESGRYAAGDRRYGEAEPPPGH